MVNFTIENGKVVVEASTLTVSAFNDIWEADESRNKAKASNMLTHVFHVCDLRDKNPLKDISYDQRPAASKRSVFGNADHKFTEAEQKLLDRAFKWYEVLNKTAIERYSAAIDKKLDQATEWLEDPKNKIDTVDQFDSQMDAISKLEKILKTKKQTDEYVREAQAKQKTQNNARRSALSAGLLDG